MTKITRLIPMILLSLSFAMPMALLRLTEAGAGLLAGRTLNEDYSSFGIIIFRADTISGAR
jgi:hypothetical protein